MAAVSPVAAELEPGAARICSEVKVKQTPALCIPTQPSHFPWQTVQRISKYKSRKNNSFFWLVLKIVNSRQGGVAVSVFRAAYFHNLITSSDDGWWLGCSLAWPALTNCRWWFPESRSRYKPGDGWGVTVWTCFLLETKRFGKEEIGLFCFNVLIHKSRHIFEASKQNYSGRQPGDKLLSNFSLMLWIELLLIQTDELKGWTTNHLSIG